MIKLIVALGNNERQYYNTRHNVAQSFIDYIFNPRFVDKLSSKYSTLFIEGRKYHLIYPNSLMNLSGKSVSRVSNFFNLDIEEILIISDDLENEFGTVEIKKGGSHKGHNGKRHIQQLLGNNNYVNLKIGIGRPSRQSVSNYVLSRFSSDEENRLPLVYNLAKTILLDYLKNEKNKKMILD